MYCTVCLWWDGDEFVVFLKLQLRTVSEDHPDQDHPKPKMTNLLSIPIKLTQEVQSFSLDLFT